MLKQKIQLLWKSEKGASLVFVVCMMLLLFSIGASVLAAASTAAGDNVGQKERAQLSVYTDSVMRSLTKAMQGQMGRGLVGDMYAHGRNSVALPTELTVQIAGMTTTIIAKPIEVEFPYQSVRTVREEVPAQPEESGSHDSNENGTIEPEEEWYSPATEKIPEIIDIDFDVRVKTAFELDGRRQIVVAKYELRGAVIYDKNLSDAGSSAGTWRLISYEKVGG